MPAHNPTAGDVHVDAVLTNISEAWVQDTGNFIADQVFPMVPVAKQSDLYYKYDQNDFWRDEAQLRAPSTESAGGGYRLSTDSYFCHIWAFHKDVDDPTRANADSPLSPDRDATSFVTTKLMMRRERLFVNSFFQSGVWGQDLTGSAAAPGAGEFLQWDQASSDPVGDVDAERNRVASQTGFMPNVLVVSPYVHSAIRNNADVRDRFKYTQGGVVSEDMLAALFEVDRYVVARSAYASNAAGATEAYDFNFGKSALLVYAAPSPALMQPTGGYTFVWSGLLGANAFGGRIKNFRMEHLEADRIEGEMAIDAKLTAASLGVFFENAVA